MSEKTAIGQWRVEARPAATGLFHNAGVYGTRKDAEKRYRELFVAHGPSNVRIADESVYLRPIPTL